MEIKKGFGLSGEEEKKGALSHIGSSIKRIAGYAAAAGLVFILGAAAEYHYHPQVKQRVNHHRGIPAQSGPGDTISFVYDESSCRFRKYIISEDGAVEIGDDNLPSDNNDITSRLYSRGLRKDFFVKAAANAQGEYPKDFVLGMTAKGLAEYPQDISLSDTVPAAWKSMMREGASMLERIGGIDDIIR